MLREEAEEGLTQMTQLFSEGLGAGDLPSG